MKKTSLYLIILSCFISHVNAQTNGQDNVVGKTYILTSKVLNQEREIQIYLPKGYKDSNKNYPVLYVLDGQRWFLHSVSLLNLFTEYQYTPEFIVVGIPTNDTQRFRFFAKGENLITFLEQEVISFVEAHYRTTKERLLFGWQYAGALAVGILAEKPTLFNAHLVASPFPLTGTVVNRVEKALSEKTRFDNHLFFATSLNETQVEGGAEELAQLLEAKAPSTLTWIYKKLRHETRTSIGHLTSPLETLYHGLRTYFHDYPVLEFLNLEEFNQAGGFANLDNYYKTRAKKYGVSTVIPYDGMFYLLRMSLEEDHYPIFSTFMDKLIDQGMLDQVRKSWAMRYAAFHLKHNHPEAAIKLYTYLLKKFPDDAKIKEKLAAIK